MPTFAEQIALDAAAMVEGEFSENVRIPTGSGGTEVPAVVQYVASEDKDASTGDSVRRAALVVVQTADVSSVSIGDRWDLASGAAGAWEVWTVEKKPTSDATSWTVLVARAETENVSHGLRER